MKQTGMKDNEANFFSRNMLTFPLQTFSST